MSRTKALLLTLSAAMLAITACVPVENVTRQSSQGPQDCVFVIESCADLHRLRMLAW